jgi:hypothetical protein
MHPRHFGIVYIFSELLARKQSLPQLERSAAWVVGERRVDALCMQDPNECPTQQDRGMFVSVARCISM